jgi:Zn-dependent alcohol dehydrogenase
MSDLVWKSRKLTRLFGENPNAEAAVNQAGLVTAGPAYRKQSEPDNRSSLSRRDRRDPSVFVFGVSTMGLWACALARYTSVSRVVAVDINLVRLAFAKDNGSADDPFCLPLPVSLASHP